MNKLLVFAIGILVLAFVACSDNLSTGPDQLDGPTDGIIPLNIGAKWTYRIWDDEESNTYVEQITGVKTFGNTNYWIRSYEYSGYGAVEDAILTMDDGLRIYPVTSGSIYTDYYFELPYPANSGDRFFYFVNESDSTYGEIEDRNATLITDLGTFKCYRYHVWSDNESSILYYSPGVGLIKSSTYSGNSAGTQYIELIGMENIDYVPPADTIPAE